MNYTYNIICVRDNKIIDILFTDKRLPTHREELFLRSSKECQCCGQKLNYKKFVVCGDYKIGDNF